MRKNKWWLFAGIVALAGVLHAERIRVPQGDAARTDEGYVREVALPFYTRHFVDSFDTSTIYYQDRVPMILDIRRALALASASGCSRWCSWDIRTKAKGLVKGGCKDPGVLLAAAFDVGTPLAERLKMLNTARDSLKKVPEPVMAALVAAKRLKLKNDDDAVEAAFAEAVAAAFACEGGFAEADSRIALRFLLPAKHKTNYHAALFKIKMPDPWVQLVLRGADLYSEAFDARGSGLAYTVTEEGWQGFGKKNAEAYKLLEAAHRLHPDWPDAAALLVSVANHSGEKSSLFWLNRSLKASLDSLAAVKNHAHFSTSRWCGSTHSILELGKACMRTRRYDSLLPYAGIDVVFAPIMRYEQGLPEAAVAVLRADRELFDLIYATVDGYLAAPERPHLGPRDFYVRAGIMAALVDGSWDKAFAYADRLAVKNTSFRDWPFLGSFPFSARGHLYEPAYRCLLYGKFARDVARAEGLLAAGDAPAALALFQEIRNRKDANKDDRAYCDVRFFQNRARYGMRSGDWFSLMPTPTSMEGLSFWSMSKTENGIVRGRNNNRSVVCGALPLPNNNIEFAGTFHFFPNNPKQKQWEVGWSFNHAYDCASYMPEFKVVRQNGADTLFVNTRKVNYRTISLEGTPERREFLASIKNGRFYFSIDGKVVFDVACDGFLDTTQRHFLGGCCVLPVIHVNTNTGISNYRCRTLPGWNRYPPWSSAVFND